MLRKSALLGAVLACFIQGAPSGPVIVELFTSEGCSSCPPADLVLQRLEAGAGLNGVEVIALGEHVTYWDREGWKDRFSADVFTQRQQDYAQRFRLDSPYTPEMVVNGQVEFVGSDEGRARKEVLMAANESKTKVELIITAGGVVAIKASGLPAAAKGADVVLAVTESGLDTDVRGGENGGHKLRHTGVVRSMTSVGRVGDAKTGNYAAQAHFHLNPLWKRENLKLVVFLQDRATKKIWSAAAIKPVER